MTLGEFRAQFVGLQCRHCHAIGLVESPRNANNGGIRPLCPACGSVSPLDGVQWLSQNAARDRRPALGPKATEDVWEANGNRCSFCGKSRALCDRLGIGLTAQHVIPVLYGGEDGPLIPYCARCQQASVAALEETRRVEEHTAGLRAIIDRIQKRFPELLEGGSE